MELLLSNIQFQLSLMGIYPGIGRNSGQFSVKTGLLDVFWNHHLVEDFWRKIVFEKNKNKIFLVIEIRNT